MNTLAIQLKDEVKSELQHNILTYWKDNITDTFTRGFYGRISGDETLHTDVIRGAIMNARILWTFANFSCKTEHIIQKPFNLFHRCQGMNFFIKLFLHCFTVSCL